MPLVSRQKDAQNMNAGGDGDDEGSTRDRMDVVQSD